MAEVQTAATPGPSIPLRLSDRNSRQLPPPTSVILPPPSSASKIRNGHLNLDTFSPVNQNGSFEFDRVLKSGYVQKRTRKTKTWKPIFLVLRPNLLSIYKDQNEAKLRHKIHLSDLTAVAFLKDPKQKRQNVFGLFSPSRNYHLEAQTKKDADEWVELIRQEARIEEEEEEMFLASPSGNVAGGIASERLGSSSPEPAESLPQLSRPKSAHLSSHRRPSHTLEYSGNELASHSDMSDVEFHTSKARVVSPGLIPEESAAAQPAESPASLPVQSPAAQPVESPAAQPVERPMLAGRNISQMSGFNFEQDPERVVWQGHLLHLKSKGGVRQWKDLWAVVRPKNIAFYKNEAEYSPRLIIPLSSVISAVEIDPVSKTKVHCMQVITEEKSYRFCAPSEESLDKSLGALKSLLARRKDNEGKRAAR